MFCSMTRRLISRLAVTWGFLPQWCLETSESSGTCSFLVADDCAVNRWLVTVVGVPVIGCASQRLNRAVQVEMEDYETDFDAVQEVMIRLRLLTKYVNLKY
ncbi:hypothetical protein JG687_00007819 [Phytophthora cactorum]|uniref:Uncharacterized protein n=1 Tax=Phytophthora cactorum TaxID=29920 RepID=A0A8T1UFL0_9STRA|nr:hypothetical protein JG687_00007819 [Phytophthora cactorum]